MYQLRARSLVEVKSAPRGDRNQMRMLYRARKGCCSGLIHQQVVHAKRKAFPPFLLWPRMPPITFTVLRLDLFHYPAVLCISPPTIPI